MITLFYHFWFLKLLNSHFLFVCFLCFKQYVNMFYNGQCMKSLQLILFQPVFLLCFCFKNLDLSLIQLTQLDFSLITLIFIITFFKLILLECFLQLKQQVFMFYCNVNNFFTTYFKHPDFTERFDLNSNSNGLMKDHLSNTFQLIF